MKYCKNECGRSVDREDNVVVFEKDNEIIEGKVCSTCFYEVRTLDKVELAKQVMREAHEGQTRWDGRPYEVHPQKVVEILQILGIHDPTILCAAYLHDVLEDTDYPSDKLYKMFGEKVYGLVEELTFKDEKGGHWDNPKLRQIHDDVVYWTQCEKLSKPAKLIKVADILANISDDGKKSHHFLAKRTTALIKLLKDLI